MPYISQKDRENLEDRFTKLDVLEQFFEMCKNLTEGELNYLITNMLIGSIRKINYGEINATIGVLECCKLEFYRRLAASYEDEKKKENGDVYK